MTKFEEAVKYYEGEAMEDDATFTFQIPFAEAKRLRDLIHETRNIDIVFEGPPRNARFVDIEDSETKGSIKVGDWFKMDETHWALRLEIVK